MRTRLGTGTPELFAHGAGTAGSAVLSPPFAEEIGAAPRHVLVHRRFRSRRFALVDLELIAFAARTGIHHHCRPGWRRTRRSRASDKPALHARLGWHLAPIHACRATRRRSTRSTFASWFYRSPRRRHRVISYSLAGRHRAMRRSRAAAMMVEKHLTARARADGGWPRCRVLRASPPRWLWSRAAARPRGPRSGLRSTRPAAEAGIAQVPARSNRLRDILRRRALTRANSLDPPRHGAAARVASLIGSASHHAHRARVRLCPGSWIDA